MFTDMAASYDFVQLDERAKENMSAFSLSKKNRNPTTIDEL
jgi:hypothetical protein